MRTAKHSLRLSFKSDYGPASLNYDWFNDPVNTFDRIVLRGLGFGDAWPTRYSDSSAVPGTSLIGLRYRPENSTYLKDAWIKESMRDLGHLATRSDFAHLYLNGLYWGLINPSERIDAAFACSHLGGREMDWDVMAGDENYNVAELRDGSRADWDALIAQVNAGISSEASYQAVLDKVDEVNLIDYMMVHGIAEMEDWPFHNWYSAHRRATNGLPATQWIFLPWDQEIGMDRYMRRDRVLAGADSDNTPGRIYTKLRAWPEFRRLYGDRVQKHFFNGGALSQSNCIARFERLGARIFQGLVPESARWGDAREFTIVTTATNPGTGQTFTRDEWWVSEMQQLYSGYFGDLHERYISIFQANGLYPLTGAPQFSQFGGGVPAGFALAISHTNADGAILFTVDGTDPRQYGSGAVAPTALTYSAPVAINAPTFIRARVLDSRGWSALVEATFYPPQDLSRLALTEIMFNPLGNGPTNTDDFEFLELKNTGTNSLNLSGLLFTSGVTYTFPLGSTLGAGQFFVLARNASVFASRYPGVSVSGVYTGRLDNGGETLTLSHPAGGKILSVNYGDKAPWPVAADGYGFSMVQVAPGISQAPDDGAKWRASSAVHGSPGADDAPSQLPPILITELLAHTDLPLLDAVELYNPNPTNVNIGGWFLSDQFGDPAKYRIPTNIIVPAYGYRTLDAAQFDPQPGILPGFAFSEFGEAVCLASGGAATNLTGYSHGFSFQASDNGVSFGRHVNSAGEESFPAQQSRTLGTNNTGPAVGPLVISEVHYHPALDGDEFVELQNISSQVVHLNDAVVPTNTWRLDGIGFAFPQGLGLAPGGFLLITATNPAAFKAKYGVSDAVTILGPYSGTLQDSGERIQLEKPSAYDPLGSGWVVVDAVRYNDQAPWPPAANGTGPSLQRLSLGAFGDEPLNWYAAAPTPGQPSAQLDSDNDGLPNAWETLYGLDPYQPADAGGDADGDGATNLEEYHAGTNPRNPASALKLAWLPGTSPLTLQFDAVSNRTYFLESSVANSSPAWTTANEWPPAPTNRVVLFPVPGPMLIDQLFRLRVAP